MGPRAAGAAASGCPSSAMTSARNRAFTVVSSSLVGSAEDHSINSRSELKRELASMKYLFILIMSAATAVGTARAATSEADRWHSHMQQVEIVRDQWGIAHVYGKSDADAVFGMIYTQAEDDFRRVEHNYLTGLGMQAQAEGEGKVYADLRQRLFIDPPAMQRLYGDCPAWLKTLMVAWADGLNFYLSTHPGVTPL